VQLIVSLAWDWRSSVAVCAWVVSGVGIAEHITKSKKEAAQQISVSLGGIGEERLDKYVQLHLMSCDHTAAKADRAADSEAHRISLTNEEGSSVSRHV
jgi:hypothetical protein